MREIFRWTVVTALAVTVLLSGPAGADVVLSSEKLNASLKQMQREQLARENTAGTTAANADFALGEEARALAELMSREVAAHGRLQQPMLDLALERTSAMGIHIAWSADHERYFYDGEAYRHYLQSVPDGPHAAESMFHILWYDYYHATPDDPAALAVQAAYKQEFLRRFPDFGQAAEVSLFLAIDYRDLWRDCREHDRQDCDGRYLALAEEQFRRVATEHAGTDQAEIAERLGQRFEAEAAEAAAAK